MHRRLLEEQLAEWPLAKKNFNELELVLSKEIQLNTVPFRIQCNPNRIQSTAANISRTALQERPCFLCTKNRPMEQKGIALHGYTLLINPFPVFPMHFTLAAEHVPQTIHHRFGDMLDIANELDDCVVFYNGPKCGASAPDHMHFQAGSKGFLPLITYLENNPTTSLAPILMEETYQLAELKGLHRSGWLLKGSDEGVLVSIFEGLLAEFEKVVASTDVEPMLNVLVWRTELGWSSLILPRKAHRPSCYFASEPDKLLISPASVEMGGLIIAARLEDYELISANDIEQIFKEVSLDEQIVSTISIAFREASSEPLLEVGVVSADTILFEFPTAFRLLGDTHVDKTFQGSYEVVFKDNAIYFQDQCYSSLEFEPCLSVGTHFVLPEVKIGIGFHWERFEKQAFEGRLKIIPTDKQLLAINRVPLESYLTSVISSEMSAKASGELLQAHAVISRSWLMSQMLQKGKNQTANPGFVESETERVRWYDREDHSLFDVCADDHCQRYQGITKASTAQVREAIHATRGQVLQFGSEICDARFSKCCGGAMETFESCWENSPKPYLQGLADVRNNQTALFPDLTNETEAIKWILGAPTSFCQTTDKRILEQVLNNYDQETTDFYRWSVSYTTDEMSELVNRRSGIDFGTILEMTPIERGVSGRIIRLKIVGSKRSMILGKELEIRRTLSNTHLYSSAFVVQKTTDGFCLRGAGWGHGVGLCQIGAAVMGDQGFAYSDILNHYYPNTTLTKRYL